MARSRLSSIIPVTALIAGCSPNDNSPAVNQPATVAEAQREPEIAATPSYVARMAVKDSASMLARFPGRFLVRNECLLFDTGAETYLPVFALQTPVSVGSDRLVLSGRTIGLGAAVTVGGGELGAGSERMLDPLRPERCRHRLLRVSSVQAP